VTGAARGSHRAKSVNGCHPNGRSAQPLEAGAFELALTTDPAQRRLAAQQAISEHLSNRISNHGPKGLAASLSRLGAEFDFSTVDVTRFSALQTSERKSAADVLQWWTDRRHALVHRGSAIQVNMEQSRSLLDFVQMLADLVDAKAVETLP
jgi:hypothetical protein